MRKLSGLVIATALAGCAAPPPPPPPPTIVNITVKATADVNKTADGQGAPVVVRVYQLSSGAGFGNAEFFQLYNADATTLGTDMTKREDLQLAPGGTKTETITLMDPAKAIGFFGGYRDFQHVTWRRLADIPARQTTNITVTASGDGIAMKTETLPPPAPKPGS